MAAALAALAVAAAACSSDDDADEATPPPAHASPAKELAVPPGFSAYRFAQGLRDPAAIAVDAEGVLWVAERDGDIIALDDSDRDRIATKRAFGTSLGLADVRGLAFDQEDGELFVSSRGRISVVSDENGDGVADTVTHVVTGLAAGSPGNEMLAVGRDGRLYFGGPGPDETSATIMTAKNNGAGLRVFATGLRAPFGIAFAPDGNLYATDDNDGRDELNRIVDGESYGWPGCADAISIAQPACDGTKIANVEFESAGVSRGFAVYDAEHFPKGYWGGAFIARLGADDRGTLDYVPLIDILTVEETGTVLVPMTFASGFAAPVDVAVGADGALYVADAKGVVYVIVFDGAAP